MKLLRPPSKQPLPDHATRVFKGKIFDVYQWEQHGYDGNTHTFEKIKRADVVLVIGVTLDGRVMGAFQEQPGVSPFTSPLGGQIEDGEDALTAAKRELLEESGYVSEEWELLEATQPSRKIDWAVYCFIARNCRQTVQPDLDGNERIEIKLFNFEDFVQFAIRPDFVETEFQIRVLRSMLEPREMNELRVKILGN